MVAPLSRMMIPRLRSLPPISIVLAIGIVALGEGVEFAAAAYNLFAHRCRERGCSLTTKCVVQLCDGAHTKKAMRADKVDVFRVVQDDAVAGACRQAHGQRTCSLTVRGGRDNAATTGRPGAWERRARHTGYRNTERRIKMFRPNGIKSFS